MQVRDGRAIVVLGATVGLLLGLGALPAAAQICAPAPPSDGSCGGVPANSPCVTQQGGAGICFQPNGDGTACTCFVEPDPSQIPLLGALGRGGVAALLAFGGGLVLYRGQRRTR